MGKFIDLTGQKFGRLTVICLNEEESNKLRPNGKHMTRRRYWNCQCECGNMIPVAERNLKRGVTISCGCYHKEVINEVAKKMGENNLKDLTGQKFGRLTVIKRVENRSNGVCWLCECECGNTKIVRGNDFKSGNTFSCGCYHREMASERMTEQVKKLWESEEFKQLHKEIKHSWKGGITPIAQHLRSLPIIIQWRKDTYIRENSKCQLTGKHVHGGNSDVHHLKSFNSIVREAHELYKIEIKEIIGEYTKEELKLLEEYVKEWHIDTSNAVLLSDEIHYLFHHEYGFGDNTPEQFEEFKERYLAGEFDNPNPTNNKVA